MLTLSNLVLLLDRLVLGLVAFLATQCGLAGLDSRRSSFRRGGNRGRRLCLVDGLVGHGECDVAMRKLLVAVVARVAIAGATGAGKSWTDALQGASGVLAGGQGEMRDGFNKLWDGERSLAVLIRPRCALPLRCG